MTDPKNMEELAAIEHESWGSWTEWMLGEIEKELAAASGDKWLKANVMAFFESIPSVQRWRRQMKTPYEELSEREKESDRKEVRKKLGAYLRAIHDA